MRERDKEETNESVMDFPKHGLCPDVWEQDARDGSWKMRDDVRQKLLSIFNRVVPSLKETGLWNDPMRAMYAHVTGSITSNSYTSNADIDLHIVPYLFPKVHNVQEKSNEVLKRAFDEVKAESYDAWHIGEAHPVEVYFQLNKFQDFMSVGCYNLIEEKWEVGPELENEEFNPYSAYYKSVQRMSDKVLADVRDVLLRAYEKAVVCKKLNDGNALEMLDDEADELKSILEQSTRLFTKIREMRKAYSQPSSREEALRFRKSKKWKIADASFKMMDKYGYTAIMRKFAELSEKSSGGIRSQIPDGQLASAVIATTKDFIGNEEKLAEVDLDEDGNESQKTKTRAWVDDIREAPAGYTWFKSVNDFIEFVENSGWQSLEAVDIDHDAGDYASQGGDYIRCLDYLELIGAEGMKVRIHSANPVGVQKMRQVIKKNECNGWREVFDVISEEECAVCNEEQTVNEGTGKLMSIAALAGMLAIPGILPAKTVMKSIKSSQRYSQVMKDVSQNVRMVGDYNAFQAANIIARTLYAEARNDGKKGMTAVASVIYNRAKGDKSLFTNACLKPKQFSCWNKLTGEEADPKNFQVKIPRSVRGNQKNEKLWKDAMAIAADMLSDSFSPTTEANMYYNDKSASPDWADQMTNVKYIGSHKFGTLKNHAAFI